MHDINFEVLSKSLSGHGVELSNIRMLSGGSNHIVFDGIDHEGKVWIIKFPTIRETEKGFQSAHVDTMFGGELSLERESYLFDLIRNCGAPAPFARGIFETPYGKCIVVECTSGCDLPKYMENCEHNFDEFISVMRSLGEHFHILHKSRFTSFGNIMVNSVLEPENITNFADRYKSINDDLMKKCQLKGGLSDSEYEDVKSFFDKKFDFYREILDIKNSPATLAITDMHGGNFFVENGKVSGYFDVESSQSAPWQFELYALRFFVFNFYGENEYKLAEKAFWNEYFEGKQDAPNPQDDELIDFFTACRLLEIFQSYWGYIDGLRDTWGERIKQILFKYMQTSVLDYEALGDIWRERDGQPKTPLTV